MARIANRANSNTILPDDYARLEKTFLRSSREKSSKRSNKSKIIISSILMLPITALFIFFISNFNIIIIPHYKGVHKSKTSINLISSKYSSSIRPMKFYAGSKITNNAVLINIPSGKKSGFSIVLKKKLDFYNSKIVLIAKRFKGEVKLFTVLRDTSFLSNADNPIKTDISSNNNNKSSYLEVPINISESLEGVNIRRINQIRFMFYQKGIDSLPFVIKKTYLERRM